MNFLYLHQYFQTPQQGVVGVAGTRSYEIAKLLTSFGHKVIMLTSNTHPNPRAKKKWTIENVDGIEVHSYPVSYSNEMNFYERVKAFTTFAFVASIRTLFIKFDIIFATSTPLTIGIPAIFASIISKKKMIFEVRDLWPEAVAEMSLISKKNPIYWIAKKFEILCYKRASHIFALSPGIKIGITKNKIPNEKVILHGRGKEGELLKRICIAKKLSNVIFSKPLPDKKDVAKLISEADITLTIYKNIPLLQTCSPNKFFDSLASGKAVITNMDGWIRSIVELNNCGIYSRPDCVEEFAYNILHLRDNKNKLKLMNLNARIVAEREFSREVLTKQMNEIFRRYQ